MSRKRRNRGTTGHGRPVQHLGSAVTDGGARVVRTGEDIDLGDITGEARQPVTAAFAYFEGTRIRVHPELTELDVVDLLEAADKVSVNDPKAMVMVKDYARSHIHPDDFETFWRLARKYGQDTTKLMVTCWKILDGITGNPTGGQSGSSDGRPETKTSSPSLPSAPVTDLGEHREKRDAYARHIQRLEDQRGEDGKRVPVNAAIQLQLITQARAQGIDLVAGRQSAAATG